MTWKEWFWIIISPFKIYWLLSLSCDLLLKLIGFISYVWRKVAGKLRDTIEILFIIGLFIMLLVGSINGIIQMFGLCMGIDLITFALMLFYILNKPKGVRGLVPSGAIKEFSLVIHCLVTKIYRKYLKKK